MGVANTSAFVFDTMNGQFKTTVLFVHVILNATGPGPLMLFITFFGVDTQVSFFEYGFRLVLVSDQQEWGGV